MAKLHLIFLFFSHTIHLPSVTAQYVTYFCSTAAGNYSKESLYRADLTTLLSSLSSNIPTTAFRSASAGEANAVALCRPDISLGTCRGCIAIAAADVLNHCPDQFKAVIWYEYCMLRYSNSPIFETLATDPNQTWENGLSNLRSPRLRSMLLEDLIGEAAGGGALLKAAAGSRVVDFNQTVYALVQCTPDLSPENCTRCLVLAAEVIPRCCDASDGVRVYMPSCNIRYELVMFYNLTRLREVILASSSIPSWPPVAGNDGDDKIRNIIIIVVSVVAFLTLAFLVGFFLRKRRKHENEEDPKIGEQCVEIRTLESIQYDFDKIKAATDSFSDANTLGQGGFGIVYKGKLEEGKDIAVKRLSRDLGQGETEFKNEVLLVARLQHRNLVRLLGFSIQGTERLLVYEFVQNGSLDHFLFDRVNSPALDWDTRRKIIRGVAKGLLYLHEDSRLRVVHRDLKASNVLLDEEMNPKISDFGLAKLVMADAAQESSRIIGTHGYMAPEYAFTGRFSIKSDVYSFGVMVLETMSGRRIRNRASQGDLLSDARRNWREGTSVDTIEPILMANLEAQPEMLKYVHIALLCVQENPDDRPTVASVVQMLNSSSSLTLPLPRDADSRASWSRLIGET